MLKRKRSLTSVTEDLSQLIQDLEMPAKRVFKKKSPGFSKPRGSVSSIARGILPYYKTARLSDKTIHTITTSDNINVGYNPTLGLNGAGAYDITFGVTQANVVYTSNNAAWNTGLVFASSAAAATLFQQYRIVRFEVDVYYSQNSAAVTATAATGGLVLPILYSVEDRENARSLTSTAQCLQYASCKVMQLGNSSGSNGGRQSIRMIKPSIATVDNSDASFAGTALASQLSYSPWLACGVNGTNDVPAQIPHGYLKFYLDPLAGTTNATIGYLTFVIKAVMQYRGID